MVLEFGDAGHGARVIEVPGDLGGGVRLVDRHHDGAREEQPEVDEAPLVGRAGDEAHFVARLQTRRGEAFREGDHLTLEFGGRDVSPSIAFRDGEQCAIRGLLHPLHEQICDVRLRVCGDDRGYFELNHRQLLRYRLKVGHA